jgi:hypothetical protein
LIGEGRNPVRDVGVAGSNPVTPTRIIINLPTIRALDFPSGLFEVHLKSTIQGKQTFYY